MNQAAFAAVGRLAVQLPMGEERRKYYRYPATGGSETCVVRHHGVERPARLVNLSSNGFRVDLNEESIVEVGDIVLMATSSGFHRVRVVNVFRDNGTLQLGLHACRTFPLARSKNIPRRKNVRVAPGASRIHSHNWQSRLCWLR